MLKRIKNKILRIGLKGISKIKDQNFWETIYNLSLKKMNFGNGGDFSESGELFVLKLIKNKLEKSPNLTIFDVGANIGNYSKAISEIFPENAKIYSFEPSKTTFELFLKNTKNIENIIPHNFGFSEQEESQILYSNIEGSGLASVYHRKLDHYGINMDKTEEIKLTTIDDFCTKINISHIHFLKLDVEGHELSALTGAKKMIENKKIDFIQFEFGGCNIDSRTYFQDFFYLLKDNYKIYRILKDGIHELPSYKENNEIFLTINYLAIKK